MSYVSPGEKLWQAFDGIISADGIFLYDIERVGNGSFRVFIDRLEGKITSEDCSRTCRRLMDYFLVEGEALEIGSEPELEVGSPGMDRHLRLSEHVQRAVGKKIRIVTTDGLVQSEKGELKRSTIVGKLADFNTERLSVIEEQTGLGVSVKFSSMKRAQVVLEL
jgi:ribosome maturation factor RimP